MAAAVVALAGDAFAPAGCAARGPLPPLVALVGVAGFYGWPLPVPSTVDTPGGRAFLGGSPATAPRAWRAATPYAWLARPGPPCTTLLVARTDPLADDARRFSAALRAAGHAVQLDVLPSGGDPTLISPRSEEGKSTVRSILAAADCAAPWPPAR
jgi:acetyl esterase/lipase